MSLEIEDNGSCHFTFTIEATVPGGGFESLPITSADVDIEISSPSSGHLEIDLSGSVTFSEDTLSELPPELTTMTPENLNLMLQPFEGQYISDILDSLLDMMGGEGIELPSEIGNLRLDSVSCTEFSWDGPTLEVGFTTTLSGSIFEDEELRAELPVTISISFEGNENSMSFLISAVSTNWEFNMTLDITVTDGTQHWSLSIEVDGVLPRFEEEGLGSLGIPSEFQDLLGEQDLSEVLEGQDVTFELTVPEGTDVSGLPSGYDKSNGTYTWTGSDAANAFESIMGGLGEGEAEEGLPWLWIGVGILVVVVIIVAAVVAAKHR